MTKKLVLVFIIFFLILFSFLKKEKSSNDVIEFASWGSVTEVRILNKLIENFEKDNPGIKIHFQHIPQNYFQKIHLLFASNTAPDVIFINNLYFPVYADYLYDLTNELTPKDYYYQTLESFTYNNKIYAIPRDVSNLVFYVNRDLLNKNKIKLPNNNWTLNDLLAISCSLREHNVYGVSYGDEIYYLLPYLNYYNGGILDDTENTVIIDTKPSRQGILFYKNLRYKYHVAPFDSEIGSLTQAQMFLDGKICFYLSGRWMYPIISQRAKFDWEVLNFPYSEKGISLDSSGWAVSKNSKHKESAIKFVKYLSKKDSIDYYTQTGLIVPARMDSSRQLNNNYHNEKIFLEVIKHSAKTPVNKKYKKITDDITRQLDL